MNIISLPNDLNLEITQPVQMFDYQSVHSNHKTKVTLTKNTISFLQEGTKEVIWDSKSVTINNDDFLIMKSGNCLMTEKISAIKNSYRSVLLFFSDELLLDFLEKNDSLIQHSKDSDPFQVCSYDGFIKNFVQSLVHVLSLEKSLQEKILHVKFEEIMTYLGEVKGIDFLYQLLSAQTSTSQRFIEVIENNKFKNLTLQELCFLTNMSLSTFKREFKKHYKTSPIKWFQEQRLENSAFILSTQKKCPTELYREMGYQNLSNFNQAFKKRFGTTPKRFQKEQMDV